MAAEANPGSEQPKKKSSGIMLRFKKKSAAAVAVPNAEKAVVGEMIGETSIVNDRESADSPGSDLTRSVETMPIGAVVPALVPAMEPLQRSHLEEETQQISDESQAAGKTEAKPRRMKLKLVQSLTMKSNQTLDDLMSLEAVEEDGLKFMTAPKAKGKSGGKRAIVDDDTALESTDVPVAKRARMKREDKKKGQTADGEGEDNGPIEARPKAGTRRPANGKAAVLSAAASITSAAAEVSETEVTVNQASTTTASTTSAITPDPTPPPTQKSATQLLRTINRSLRHLPKIHADLKSYHALVNVNIKHAHKTITALRKELATMTQKAVRQEQSAKEGQRAALDMMVFWQECWVDEWGKGVIEAEASKGVERDRYCRPREGVAGNDCDSEIDEGGEEVFDDSDHDADDEILEV